jgi:hypothetical protein
MDLGGVVTMRSTSVKRSTRRMITMLPGTTIAVKGMLIGTPTVNDVLRVNLTFYGCQSYIAAIL